RHRYSVGRIEFAGQLVFAERRLELILVLELLGALLVRPRGGLHRALQRDLVVRIVGRCLYGRPVVRDRLIEIAGARRRLAPAEGLAGRTPAGRPGDRQQESEPAHTAGHNGPFPMLSGPHPRSPSGRVSPTRAAFGPQAVSDEPRSD